MNFEYRVSKLHEANTDLSETIFTVFYSLHAILVSYFKLVHSNVIRKLYFSVSLPLINFYIFMHESNV